MAIKRKNEKQMLKNQESSRQKTADRRLEIKTVLYELFDKEPELAAKLVEALETDRYFITISYQKKDKPDDQHDLRHYWLQHKYKKDDVVPGLKHLAADFIAKENPTAQLPADSGWH